MERRLRILMGPIVEGGPKRKVLRALMSVGWAR